MTDRIFLFLLIVLPASFLAYTPSGEAYQLLRCADLTGIFPGLKCESNDKVSRWVNEQGKSEHNRPIGAVACSVGGQGTLGYQLIESAADGWNSVYGARDTIKVYEQSCPDDLRISYRDAKSSIAFVESSRFLDGAKGAAIFGYRLDHWGNHDHVDIVLDYDSIDRRAHTCTTTGAKAGLGDMVLHEMGHALGLAHEDRALMAAVKNKSLYGTAMIYCSESRLMVSADDARGHRAVYPSGNKSYDLAVSNRTMKFNVSAQRYIMSPYNASERLVCPGETVGFSILRSEPRRF